MIFYCCRMQSQRARVNTLSPKRTNLWSQQQTEIPKKQEIQQDEDSDDDNELELFKKRMQQAPPRYYLVCTSEEDEEDSQQEQLNLSNVEEQQEDEYEDEDTTRLSQESSLHLDSEKVPDDKPNVQPKSLEPFYFKKGMKKTSNKP